MNYKASRYNVWHKGENGVLLYNIYTTGLLFLEKDYIDRLKQLLDHPEQLGGFSEQEQRLILDNGFLVQEDVDEIDMVRYRYRKSGYDNSRLTITMIPTKACNLACEYCFEHNKAGARMSDEDCDHILKFIEKELTEILPRNFLIYWYGGEPLLALDVVEKLCGGIKEICEKLGVKREKDIMISNGYLMDEEKAARLKELGIETIQISLDGNREEHDKRRVLPNGKGTFDRCREAIEIASRHFTNVAVRVNTNKDNLAGIEEMLEADPIFKKPNVIVNIGPLKTYLGGTMTKDEDVACFKGPELQQTQIKVDRMLDKKKGKDLQEGIYSFQIKGNNCGADQLKTFVIAPGALVYKCYERVDPGQEVGAIRNGVFTPNHNFWKWTINEPFEHQACVDCLYLPVCMGGCPSVRMRLGLPNSESCGYWQEWLDIKLQEIDRANRSG